MQYVRSLSGSVSKTWNSINPATLSGAIDVIVVEHEDGSLACSPFHVRFGKFSLLRPSEKKVVFKVNDVEQDYAMKLGEGGEAFFVFETSASVPVDMQTSPLVSPASSPQTKPSATTPAADLPEPDPLDLATDTQKTERRNGRLQSGVRMLTSDMRTKSDLGNSLTLGPPEPLPKRPVSGDWGSHSLAASHLARSITDDAVPTVKSLLADREDDMTAGAGTARRDQSDRSTAPSSLPASEAVTRAISLSKKLWGSNIPSQVTDRGDLMLDMTGYKSSEEEALRAEVIARKILSEELEGDYDIGSLIGADDKGNLWIYSSEEAKDAAGRQATFQNLSPHALISSDAVSDPGYHSDDNQSVVSENLAVEPSRGDSDSAVGLVTPPKSPEGATAGDPNRNYAKTLRLTSDQLKALNLKPGPNPMTFSVNRATCQAYMYYWKSHVPIVISDIDGTITKSDALGHVLNMIGRDWTHQGVAKLYSEIVANGYNILYLTSRSVGQADTTRAYLKGVVQDGFKLPKGPVIMSPDRTIAALRREVYLRKPEVFKMACLRDIMSLFNRPPTPFYAGFGNRLTDALSYRSVNIPSTRIFTINSDSEVSLDLLSLNRYKTGYASMREIVDHFFPPVGLLLQQGAEEFTDFNYWRDTPLEVDDFSGSESGTENDGDDRGALADGEESLPSEDEGIDAQDEEGGEDLEASYFSRRSVEEQGELGDSIIESVEGGSFTDPQESEQIQSRLAENGAIIEELIVNENDLPDDIPVEASDVLLVPETAVVRDDNMDGRQESILVDLSAATEINDKHTDAVSPREVQSDKRDGSPRSNLHGLAQALTARGKEGAPAPKAANPPPESQRDEAVRVA